MRNSLNTVSAVLNTGAHINRVANGEETVGEAVIGAARDAAVGTTVSCAATSALTTIGGAGVAAAAAPFVAVSAVVYGLYSLFSD